MRKPAWTLGKMRYRASLPTDRMVWQIAVTLA
jgi:hypothetical protein